MTYRPSAGYAGSYSVEAWVMPFSATKYYQNVVDSRAPGPYDPTTEYSMDFGFTGSANPGGQQICADIGDGYEWLANPCTSFTFRAHQWYYLAMTVSDLTGVANFFVNGRAIYGFGLFNYGLPPLLTDQNHPIVLGGDPRYDHFSPDPGNFDGVIGQVAVYKYALSPKQVTAHYSAGRSA